MPDFIAKDPAAREAYLAGQDRAKNDLEHPEQQILPNPQPREKIGSLAVGSLEAVSPTSGVTPIEIKPIGHDDGTGRSAGARRRQSEIDLARERSRSRELRSRGYDDRKGR